MATVAQRLNRRIQRDVNPDDPATGDDEWQIDSRDEAAWASRKAAQARQEIAEIDEWEQREIARIRAAAKAERRPHQSTASFFEHHLNDYLRREIEDGRDKKSMALPGGTIKRYDPGPKIEWDTDAALDFAQSQGIAGACKVSLRRSALKNHLEETDDGKFVNPDTGEIVEFVSKKPQPDRFKFDKAGQ